MTTSTDTNIFVSLWDRDANNLAARRALDAAQSMGEMVVCGAVYAELLGGARRTPEMLQEFFSATGIAVDWRMDRPIWERAGMAYQVYVQRRGSRNGSGKRGAESTEASTRRQLTDFLIGAHASRHGHRILTLDKRLYRAAFPEVEIVSA